MTCPACQDPDTGEALVPYYGVGPHVCFYKIPGATIGQSRPLPRDQWPANYREDPESPGHGLWWCEVCGEGATDAQELIP
ncbi:hypothetical protein PSQ40_04665 [Curvibacter sp. HBC61]|uniref:Rubredoxin-like domain-containing protein n=1 Tax=Curvibacter cyanobacteriorum TaxID=3026422 RepID=A0ABT5MVI6_9BURK|nr:hypothetical protein [Curvibacter sp. HBC61]MDD0837857.1 hypothetical protein [Curvibacter sp. HBC61]